MINWFNMPAEGLSNGGQFEIKELSVTENGEYEKDGEVYSKVTVNVEGGGGSSDFSTAEVTVTAFDPGVTLAMPVIITFDDVPMLAPSVGVNSTPKTLIVPLYKGKAVLVDEDYGESAVITGDIEYDEDLEAYIISGDGTITLTE